MAEEEVVVGTVQQFLSPDNYHTPKPKPPEEDKRAKSLYWPPRVAAVGLIIFAFFGYGLSSLDWLMESGASWIVDVLTLIASLLLAVGSEGGTMANISEIFRKHGQGKATKWDWIAIFVSQITTIFAVLQAWCRLRGLEGRDIGWVNWVNANGSLILCVFASADIAFGMVEHGLYCATYDERHTEWEAGYHQWCKREAIAQGWASTDLSELGAVGVSAAGVDANGTLIMPGGPSDSSMAKPVAPVKEATGGLAHAGIDDWRAIVAGLEWSPATGVPLSVDDVQRLLSEQGYGPATPSTARRWAQMANDGTL